MVAETDTPCGHRQLEHTADLALELWARSEPELLGEGARAVIEILAGTRRPRPLETRTVELSALDPADRLVQWLNEILYLATVEGFLTAGADVRLSPRGLSATLRGETVEELETEIKSATYHELEVKQDAGRWHARVVLDV